MDRSPTKARCFDRWSMGLKHLQPSDVEVHPGYTPYFGDGFDATAIGAMNRAALELLKNFASRQGR